MKNTFMKQEKKETLMIITVLIQRFFRRKSLSIGELYNINVYDGILANVIVNHNLLLDKITHLRAFSSVFS